MVVGGGAGRRVAVKVAAAAFGDEVVAMSILVGDDQSRQAAGDGLPAVGRRHRIGRGGQRFGEREVTDQPHRASRRAIPLGCDDQIVQADVAEAETQIGGAPVPQSGRKPDWFPGRSGRGIVPPLRGLERLGRTHTPIDQRALEIVFDPLCRLLVQSLHSHECRRRVLDRSQQLPDARPTTRTHRRRGHLGQHRIGAATKMRFRSRRLIHHSSVPPPAIQPR